MLTRDIEPLLAVAPYTGAWIETDLVESVARLVGSHPIRVRGLKHCSATRSDKDYTSHPIRVRGLKQAILPARTSISGSHPIRVRGLKLLL